MVITDDNIDSIIVLKHELTQEFDMKDLGLLHYFLVIEVVACSFKGYLLS